MNLLLPTLIILFSIPTFLVIAQTENDVDELIDKGFELYLAEKYEESIPYFDKVLSIEPDYAEVWYMKGVVLSELEKYDIAFSYLEKALEINPNYIKAINKQGLILSHQEKYEEAITYFDKALEINPNYIDSLIDKGVVLTRIEKYEEAITYFDQVLEIDPFHVQTIVTYAAVLNKLEEYFDAKILLIHALDLDPKNILAKELYNIASSGISYSDLDGELEVIIRDPNNSLVGYFRTTNLKIIDHSIAEFALEEWTEEKTITIDGVDYKLLQKVEESMILEETAFGQFGIASNFDLSTFVVYSYGNAVVINKGDTLTFIFKALIPVQ